MIDNETRKKIEDSINPKKNDGIELLAAINSIASAVAVWNENIINDEEIVQIKCEMIKSLQLVLENL